MQLLGRLQSSQQCTHRGTTRRDQVRHGSKLLNRWDLLANKMQLTDLALERAHTVGQASNQRPRPVLARFLRYSDRETVMRNATKLRGTKIFINDDLCQASQEKRKEELPLLKQARSDGKIAYFRHTKLIIRDRMNTEARGSGYSPNGPTVGENGHNPGGAADGVAGGGAAVRAAAAAVGPAIVAGGDAGARAADNGGDGAAAVGSGSAAAGGVAAVDALLHPASKRASAVGGTSVVKGTSGITTGTNNIVYSNISTCILELPFSSISDTDLLQCINSDVIIQTLCMDYLQNLSFEPLIIQDRKYNNDIGVNTFYIPESIVHLNQNTSFSTPSHYPIIKILYQL